MGCSSSIIDLNSSEIKKNVLNSKSKISKIQIPASKPFTNELENYDILRKLTNKSIFIDYLLNLTKVKNLTDEMKIKFHGIFKRNRT
jgi:hypothetical protein